VSHITMGPAKEKLR